MAVADRKWTRRTVLARVPKGEDIEVHISLVSMRANREVIDALDVRDFVVSSKTYGRGTLLPATDATTEALEAAVRSLRYTGGA